MSKRPDSELSPAAQALLDQHLQQNTPDASHHDRVWERVQHSLLPVAGIATVGTAASGAGSGSGSAGAAPGTGSSGAAPGAAPGTGISGAATSVPSAGSAALAPGAGAGAGTGATATATTASATAAAAKGAAVGMGLKTGILGTTLAKAAVVLGISGSAAGVWGYQNGYFESAEDPKIELSSRNKGDGATPPPQAVTKNKEEVAEEVATPVEEEPSPVPSDALQGASANASSGGDVLESKAGADLTPALLEQLGALAKIDAFLRKGQFERARLGVQEFSKAYPGTPFASDLRALRVLLQCKRGKMQAPQLRELKGDPRLRRYWPRIRAACQSHD